MEKQLDSFSLPSIEELGIDKKDRKFLHTQISRLIILGFWMYGLIVSRVMNKIEVIGRENDPRDVGNFYGANHYTFIDSILIAVALYSLWDILFNFDLLFWNLAAAENFFNKPIFRFIFGHLKNVPTVRAKGISAGAKLKFSESKEIINLQKKIQAKILVQGNLLYFFGEGRDKSDEEINKCTRGAASLIFDCKSRFVPILLQNIRPIMPDEKFRIFSGLRCGKKGQIIIGKPVNFDEYYKLDRDSAIKKIAEAVTASVNELKKTKPLSS